MPPALDGLPNEIISSILTQLHGDQATLAAICRVSRYLGSVATAPLYRVIQQHEDGPHDPRRTPLLLRTLLLNPALGSYIVEVQFKMPGQEHEDVSCFSEEEWVLLRAQVSRLYGTGLFTDDLFSKNILHSTDPCDGAGSEQTWNKNVREGQWDAVFSLMLYCCPHLEKLRGYEWNRWDEWGHLYPGFYFFTFFMSGVALSKAHLHAQKSRPGPDRVPILPHYRYAHLSLKARSPGQPILLQPLLPFLYSSAIELVQVDTKFEGGGTQCHKVRLWGNPMFPTKKLVIRGSLMSANTLRCLLDSCEVLEEFTLEYGIVNKNLYVSMRRMVHGRGQRLRGLLRSKKTLTKLEMGRGFSVLYAQKYSRKDQTLGSLRDFEVLTHLTVKLEFLIWHAKPSKESSLCNIMPRSLEFLSIATEDVLASADLTLFIDTVSKKERSLLRNVPHFEELVLRKESVVPNLRHLVLDGIQRETADSSALAILKRACATSSVQLSIVLYHRCFSASGKTAMSSERVDF